MASDWSDLKIQLMGTGDNNGTWGNITNLNLGVAIEEAITGSATVTFSSGDETLTLSNTTASQEARNLRLDCTGTTGGARNLILGSGCQIQKVYIVNNGCADTITIKNTTGAGVAVPAGKTMYVYNTGSNVVDAITHLTSLTLDTPLPVSSGGTGSNTGPNVSTVTGVLPIANGGTGSNTGVNVSTVDGVLPVLNGGTGSNIGSFSGANITSLNATNISTGTLVVSRGGTGLSTLDANNVILGNGTSSVQFVAPGTSGNVLSSNGTTWVSTSTGVIVSGTPITLSGTQADFTGLPSGIKRITIMVHNMSLSGTSIPIIRIGGSGGIITSGYLGAQNSQPTGADPGGTSNQTGFLMNNGGAATNFISGTGVLTKLSDFIYTYSSNWGIVGGAQQFVRTMLCNGSIDAGSAVDSIRLTSTNGSDVFDSGTFNIMYET
jgi:hypothetical protein